MVLNTNKDKGRAGLALGIAYFGTNGYTVCLPMNDTQWYDMIVEKEGKIQTVQCKFTGSKNNEIVLKSCGGTDGSVYDNILNHSLDILFCADKDKNLFVIPMEDLRASGNTGIVTLRTVPNVNNQGFNTYKYIVQI